MAGTHGEHLGADHLAHLGHQLHIPGGGQAQAMGERGGAAMQEAAHTLFMNHRRNPQPTPLHQHPLDVVCEGRRFVRQQSGAGADAGDLADAVRQLRGGHFGVEHIVADQVGQPDRPELGHLFLQGHSPEKIAHTLVDGCGGVFVRVAHR